MSGANEALTVGATSRAPLPAPEHRHVLFLQGPLSPLYRRIGAHLRAEGVKVSRINLCAGDCLHWPGPGARSYRGHPEDWPEFIDEFMRTRRVTDLVCHGDQRLYHRPAIDAAYSREIRVYVSEMGLLRSGWMTFERNGLSTLSCFPDDPQAIRAIAARVGNIDLEAGFEKSTWLEIGPDVIYNLLNVFAWVLHPWYERHTIYHPVPEYLRGGLRLLRKKARDAEAAERIAELRPRRTPLFLLPLQLEGDFQLRAHSPYKSFAEVIDRVLASFAAHAPERAQLLIKSHPLDAGFENWPQKVEDLARRRGLVGRVVFLDGGRLSDLWPKLRGVVTLNSTAGLEALQAGVPVKTLVPAHFDIAGLTHSDTLDSFWTAPVAPDQALLADYLKAIAATIQVRGSIHNREGVEEAARNMAARILADSVNEPGACVLPPPRLARARALGVAL